MKKLISLTCLALSVAFIGCQTPPKPSPVGPVVPGPTPVVVNPPAPVPTPTPAPPPSPAPAPAPEAQGKCQAALAWEVNHPERKAWSNYLCAQINLHFTDFNKALDAARICATYQNLSQSQKVTAWAQFMVGDAKYESAWDPKSRMTETSMGTDPITGRQVESEGLWQLSYQDMQWAPYCRFDWSKDKLLSPTDAKKTILDPYINTECAMGIMADQIRRKGKAMLTSSVYWSTLRDGGKYSQIPAILKLSNSLSFCR